ncbi:acetyl-CoA carboxylase biotin carboxylase subunit family protein [Streptomyces noursei]|uniref:ATP-grasp domain-containing protein n=1 Tax=Streptomyces noursei TaxID=1971 RepID=UPI00081CD216|nr:carboxylase [Streptomyces noursei ATCC 11455]ANZ21922.1 carboxylase [Streptomyces noursei ATCC 11455]MCZ0996518.1 ATP-grasp domain-containing protein [Streptomyces noursei]
MRAITSSSRPVLVVLGAGDADMRAFTLEQIAATHPVLLMDTDPPAWAWPHTAAMWDIDLRDHDAVAAAITQLHTDRGVAGVTTYMEHHVELAARLAEDLGLPGANTAAMHACRDKALARTVFAEHAVPSAAFAEVQNEQEAVRQAKKVGYPVVVKPRGMAGSIGVLRADTPDEVRRAFETASEATVLGLHDYAVRGTLVEEYLPGPEISVECIVLGETDIRIIAVTRKSLGPEPRFVEVGHLVDAHDPLRNDHTIAEVTTAAIRSLGIQLGAVHVELRLTKAGPRVVEVNGRQAGDLIPLLVQLATGISLPRASAELALGRTPDLTPTRQDAAAIRFLYSSTVGQIEHQRLDDSHTPEDENPGTTDQSTLRQTNISSWLERIVWTRQVGAIVEDGLTIEDRLAHWVVTGPNIAACENRLAEMDKRVTCTITPLAPFASTCVR